MMDTLLVGDYILVNKFLVGAELPFTDWRMPGLRDPHRGDIIVFKYPQDEKRDFIKRIIGTPGDSIQIRGRQVYVNGTLLVEPYTKFADGARAVQDGYCGYSYGCQPTTVPPDSYFVMGDNRDNSQDSRYWGFVKRDKIKGKAFLTYWSWGPGWRRRGRVETVFPAGGPPSFPTPDPLAATLVRLRAGLAVAPEAETTVKCNPRSGSGAKLEPNRRAG